MRHNFLGKITLLDMFLTFKLIFKQSMLLTSAFFGRARAHTCPKRFITERGVQGRNFEDRDFGFFPKVIICAQLTYSGGFVCPTRAHVPFFVHSSMCDISFPGKLTMLDTFLTFKLIFEHSWLHPRAVSDKARAHNMKSKV